MKPGDVRRVICIPALAPIFSPAQALPEPEVLRQPELAQQAPAKPAPRPELALRGAVSTNPLSFVAIAPCRLVDTRSTTAPAFPAGFGPPSLLPSLPRNFAFPQAGCGLPTNPPPQAYSLNVTVIPIAGASPYGGFIVTYPGGAGPVPGPTPFFAGLVWQGSTVYLSNALIVASNSTDGSVYVDSNVRTDVVIDVKGYFTAPTDSASSANTALAINPYKLFLPEQATPPMVIRHWKPIPLALPIPPAAPNLCKPTPPERPTPPAAFRHSKQTPPGRATPPWDFKHSPATSWG